ncbi:glycosyltransferase [Streptomyces dysideae]|uniref:glycosyltransferase n=1 Tax=Streptomyces dysideae TaxID=909626 RepID=UPI001F20C98F|nr:glycosyltransferase [Streptomyces dysideae]
MSQQRTRDGEQAPSQRSLWSRESSKRASRATNRPPTLSVIVPCCNIESYVPETVTSLVNNERDDFEFIFVEDRSSKDKTYEALLTLTKRLKNSRVYLVNAIGRFAKLREVWGTYVPSDAF